MVQSRTFVEFSNSVEMVDRPALHEEGVFLLLLLWNNLVIPWGMASSSQPTGSVCLYSIYMGLKRVTISSLWALSVYSKARWSLWECDHALGV